MQLFIGYSCDEDGNRKSSDKVPIRCAGITDCDPGKEEKPTFVDPCECGNRLYDMVDDLTDHENCRLFCNLKTLEYDLALEGNNLQLMSRVYLKMIDTDGANRRKTEVLCDSDWADVDIVEKAEESCWLLNHISSQKGRFAQLLAYELSRDENADIAVPTYIRDAILWAIGEDLDA
jgi:hypothetical protein